MKMINVRLQRGDVLLCQSVTLTLFDCQRDYLGIVFLESPPAADPLTPSVCQTRQQPWFPPIVLFEDTNPLRRPKCETPVRPVVIPGCQLQTRDPQRRADHACVERLSPACSARAHFADSRRYWKFESIARGTVGTALSAADNVGLRQGAVSVFPPPGSRRPGAVTVFAWQPGRPDHAGNRGRSCGISCCQTVTGYCHHEVGP